MAAALGSMKIIFDASHIQGVSISEDRRQAERKESREHGYYKDAMPAVPFYQPPQPMSSPYPLNFAHSRPPLEASNIQYPMSGPYSHHQPQPQSQQPLPQAPPISHAQSYYQPQGQMHASSQPGSSHWTPNMPIQYASTAPQGFAPLPEQVPQLPKKPPH